MAIRTVGFIGLGTMGSRMAPHIASAGFPLHVYDINTDAAEALARAHNGIVVEHSAKAVAAACEAVITMLPAGPDVQQVTLGKGGLIEGFAKGDVLIDMSSSQPWLTVELAAALKRAVDLRVDDSGPLAQEEFRNRAADAAAAARHHHDPVLESHAGLLRRAG